MPAQFPRGLVHTPTAVHPLTCPRIRPRAQPDLCEAGTQPHHRCYICEILLQFLIVTALLGLHKCLKLSKSKTAQFQCSNHFHIFTFSWRQVELPLVVRYPQSSLKITWGEGCLALCLQRRLRAKTDAMSNCACVWRWMKTRRQEGGLKRWNQHSARGLVMRGQVRTPFVTFQKTIFMTEKFIDTLWTQVVVWQCWHWIEGEKWSKSSI